MFFFGITALGRSTGTLKALTAFLVGMKALTAFLVGMKALTAFC